MSTFPTITLADIKKRGTNALPKGQAVYLIVNSRKHSVVVPAEEYEAMVEMIEEWEDIQIVEQRRHEKGIPLEKAFPKLKHGRRSVSR
jgi:PHD/YefM family antitoxin component YafN of YafNO toxin-antitoxin module